MKLHILCALLVVLSGFLCGCTQVRPWEKGTLARSDMALEPAILEARLKQHMYQSKEASSGGYGIGGGGCGCN